MMIGLLVGCGTDDSARRADEQPAVDLEEVAAPKSGGTAVIAMPADPDVLNPLIRTSAAAGMVLAEMLDALVELEEDMQWRGRIARSWHLAPDSLSLTYNLRPWLWSDGQPLTAFDVAHSFELYKDEAVASPRRGIYADIRRAVVVDSLTIRYEFDRPLVDPLYRTGHQILPRHLLDGLDPAAVRSWPLNEAPLSCGAFEFVSWERNHSLVLARNPYYPGVPSRLDRVVFRVIPEEAARVVALENGEVDFVADLGYAAAERLRASDKVRVVPVGGRQYYYLVWNCRLPELADAATRHALSLAIDRRLLIDNLAAGYGTPATSPIPPVVWNHHDGLPEPRRDVHEARRLLRRAGWLDGDGDGVLERAGRPLRLEVLTRQGDVIRENGLVILRQNLAEVGATVVPRVLEHATSLDRVRAGDFAVYFGRFNANLFGDPSGLVQSDAVDRFNFGAYGNATVDSLLEVVSTMTDRRQALPVWYRLQEVLAEDPPAAWLFYLDSLVGVGQRLHDVRPHVLSPINNLAEWWIAPEDRRYRSH